MTFDKNHLKEIIPFYLNGTLSEDEKKRVEEVLEKNPEMKRELLEFSRIKEVFDNEPFPEPPAYIYRKIEDRIRAEERSILKRLMAFLKSLYDSRTVSWGLVGVQAVFILFLFFRASSPTYRTLSTAPSHQGTYINVVFNENIREKTLRSLLTRVGATIVEGPTEKGLYVIKLERTANAEEAIKILKDSGKVKLVARAYR